MTVSLFCYSIMTITVYSLGAGQAALPEIPDRHVEEDSEDSQHIDIYQSKNRSECKVYSR